MESLKVFRVHPYPIYPLNFLYLNLQKQLFFAPIGMMWPEFKVEPINFYESGDTVFVHVHMTAEGLDTESIHMIKIQDGKYVAFQPFDDSAAMLKAAKP